MFPQYIEFSFKERERANRRWGCRVKSWDEAAV